MISSDNDINQVIFGINWQILIFKRASWIASSVVMNCLLMQETEVCFLGPEVPIEEGLATHSSILARKIPWTEQPVRLWSTGSKRVEQMADSCQWMAKTTTIKKKKSWTGVKWLSKHACNQVIVSSLGTCSRWLKIESSMSLNREVLCMTFLKKIHVLLHSTLQFS